MSLAKKINNYSPILLLVVSIFFSYLSISFRKGDWVTGGLLLGINIPIYFLELLTILAFYISKRPIYKRVFLIIDLALTSLIIIFYLVYVIKYN